MDILTIGILLFIIIAALIGYRINSIAADEYRRYLRSDITRGQEKELKAFRKKTRQKNAHLNKRPDESDNNTKN